MIRVAVVVGKMNSGGIKSLIMEYYRHIDKSQVQFDFICDSDSKSIAYDEINSMGGRVLLVAPYRNIFKNMRDIYKLCVQNKYPVIHAYLNTLNPFSLYAAQKAGVPVRISESLSMAHRGEFKTIFKKILRPLSKHFATHYMACGEDCGRWQFGDELFDSGKIAVFKTVVDSEFNSFKPELREETRKNFGWSDKIVIGSIARFAPQKNPIFMLEIFAEICKIEPRAVLCLIGYGKLLDAMMRRIDELGIKSHVNYLGLREDIQQFYNAMDCFLLPSLYEGLPVVGLEAESCGLPVYFSTEITREASACELGHFMSLKSPASEWARDIIIAVNENMPNRRSRAKDVKAAGYDSRSEALRLQQYYFDAINEIKANRSD